MLNNKIMEIVLYNNNFRQFLISLELKIQTTTLHQNIFIDD